ncbi:TetR-like C-terminal domain-containing protein [Paracoccus sanguinis]|uniref:TetR/AcrR family transcriptional regulator n=1 Tax=Paracoccus sanguinis TaxID=1545044 RepID=A0A1H2ZFK5_9RHOB|nr:TetR-like C-terminal domain-containing protein [Paracoccus sanguinis]KGJ17480.1 hypothetical protein IX57_08200 [Paracoccus sanguinis]SDX16135.1 hypothetical protein SAMN05444276_10358 [Paracoccus sanguinis]
MAKPGETLTDRLIQEVVCAMLGETPTMPGLDDAAGRAGIDIAIARTIFPTDDALHDAVGSFGILRLTDHISRALIDAPPGDARAGLVALGVSYVDWARANPELYRVVGHQIFHREGVNYAGYDAGFRVLVERHLGVSRDTGSLRPLLGRAFVFGLADIVLDDHFAIWKPTGMDDDTAIRQAVEEMVDLLMSPPRATA